MRIAAADRIMAVALCAQTDDVQDIRELIDRYAISIDRADPAMADQIWRTRRRLALFTRSARWRK
jgi:hypothetical protein